MTQKPAPPVKPKRNAFLGAVCDLLLLGLLLAAAGFGGYFYGTHQKLAVVDLVPEGTSGAREMTVTASTTMKPGKDIGIATKTSSEAQTQPAASKPSDEAKQTDNDSSAAPPTKHVGKMKYWLASTGDRMVGYSITATVNDSPVDNFFAPGKQVDVTDLVKKGQNTVKFEAKKLEDSFNQHKGDKKFGLTLQLVHGPAVTDNFKPSDVLAKYRRNAAETENFSEEMDFTVE